MSDPYIPEAVRARVRTAAGDRCGYCRSPQRLVLGWLEIERIIPSAAGGSDDEENLWLACRLCNNYKGTQIEALDPVNGFVSSIHAHNGGRTILPGAARALASLAELLVAAPR